MADITAEFERCWPWLDAAMASFGRTHSKAQVWEDIFRGHACLWSDPNAAIVTNFVWHPIGFKSCNIWLQGGELSAIHTLHPPIEAWARAQGCARLIGWGRDGWTRALDGWHPCGTRRAKWLVADVPEHLRETKHA